MKARPERTVPDEIALRAAAQRAAAERLEITRGRYAARFVRSPEELRRALRLRYEVFNIELGEGLEDSHSEGLDRDHFDDQFLHLVCFDRKSGELVGTYRLQTSEIAALGRGFYSSVEFATEMIPESTVSESIELGRACIAAEHRNSAVLFLLWQALAEYSSMTGKRYFFGCCSLTSEDEALAAGTDSFVRENGLLNDSFIVPARGPYRCSEVGRGSGNIRLPKLFSLYMEIGARVCSEPAIDRSFGTIDFLVMIDRTRIDSKLARYLFAA